MSFMCAALSPRNTDEGGARTVAFFISVEHSLEKELWYGNDRTPLPRTSSAAGEELQGWHFIFRRRTSD